MGKNVVKRESTVKGDTDQIVPLAVDYTANTPGGAGISDVGNLNPSEQARNAATREAKAIIIEAEQKRDTILTDLESELIQRRQAHNMQLAASADKHEKEIAERRTALERDLRGELENEFRTRYEQAIKSLENAAASLGHDRDKYLKQIEAPAMNLVLEISRQLIGQELKTNGKILGGLIVKAFEMLRPDETVNVHVHPAAFHLLLENESFNTNLSKAGFNPKLVELDIDETLAPDQFKAELSGMKVEFDLQSSISELIKILTKEIADQESSKTLPNNQ